MLFTALQPLKRFAAVILLVLVVPINGRAARFVEMPLDIVTRLSPCPLRATLRLDADQQNGSAIYLDNQLYAGTYAFVAYAAGPATGHAILKVVFDGNPYCSTAFDTWTLFFFVDPARSSFTYLGATTYTPVSTAPLDTATGYWQALGKLFVSPTAMLQADAVALRPLTSTLYYQAGDLTTSSLEIDSSILASCVLRLLDGLSEAPGAVLGYDFLQQVSWSLIDEDTVLSADKERIHQRLWEVWDELSPASKRMFFLHGVRGNSQSSTILGTLFVDYLAERRASLSAFDYSNELNAHLRGLHSSSWGNLGFPRLFLGDHGVPESLEYELVAALLSDFSGNLYFHSGQNAFYALNLIKSSLLIERPNRNADAYHSLITPYIGILSGAKLSSQEITELTYLLVHFSEFLPAGFYDSAALAGVIQTHLNTFEGFIAAGNYASLYPAYYRFLLFILEAPLPEAMRSAIEDALRGHPVPSGLFSFASFYGIALDTNHLSQSLQTDLLTQSQVQLQSLLDSRGTSVDTYSHDFERQLVQWCRFMKAGEHFPDVAPLFLNFLPQLNPRQSGESESSYSGRLAKIQELWLEAGIIVMDFSGGGFRGNVAYGKGPVDYLDIFNDHAAHFPGWIRLIVMSTSESAEAKPGAVQFNWQLSSYDSAYEVGRVLLHEGTHSFHLEPSRKVEQFNPFIMSNFFNHDSLPHHRDDLLLGAYTNLVTSYARTNVSEYFAEVTRYWHLDGASWLKFAARMFHENNPAHLNMFVFLNQEVKSDMEDTSTAFLLHSLNATTGLLQSTPLPGSWLRGDKQDGVFGFQTADGLFSLVYERGLVVDVYDYVDHDSDRMPDWWELRHGLDPDDDGTDRPDLGPDGVLTADGLTNLQKFAYGFEARSAVTAAPLKLFSMNNNELVFKYRTRLHSANLQEEVLVSTDLAEWDPLSALGDLNIVTGVPQPVEGEYDLGEIEVRIQNLEDFDSLFLRSSIP